jgi:hypothetical protein
MHKLNFFPLGNADCCRIDLANGKRILFDYANMRDPESGDDKRIDLEKALREDLDASGRNAFDIVAFTHLDEDHIKGAGDFFWFEHAKGYQGDERIKMDMLWVPAAVITEEGKKTDDARLIQAEARHRLRNKERIRVFSRPEALKEWLQNEGMTVDEVRELTTDAGQVVPGLKLAEDGLEFFAHSPFASPDTNDEMVDRNLGCLIVHGTFSVDEVYTKVILGADATHELLSEIVQVTREKKRPERLEWDVFELPHHCSYAALGPEKGAEETEPVKDVSWLFETQGQHRGIIVSPSKPIPSDDEDDQPPHRQAANYYKRILKEKESKDFKVTMEHPKESAPETLVIRIGTGKAGVEKRIAAATVGAYSKPSPRAG